MEHNTSRPGRPSRRLVHRRLEEAVAELRSRMGGLPSPTEAEGIWTSIWYQEAHHSTALEGNTLVMQQVEELLAEGRAVGNKELREYMEVKSYADAARWVYGQALDSGEWESEALVTLTEVRHIHRLALGPVWGVAPHPSATAREGPGGFRQHDIQPFPGGLVPPSWVEVEAAMADWLTSLSSLRSVENQVESIAASHGIFEGIHPFLDGNGRTGRLVLNLLLVRLGYPPAVIYTRDRNRYLRALRRSDAGDPGPLGELIARAVTDNLYRFVVPAVAGPRRLVPLAALATQDRSVFALRAAIERGRLRAQKGPDGQWRSTGAWVDEYLASKYQRRA
ncbi:MAG: Fic family protein [Acidimicrobiales bacterium]